jgi:hypothetical protein
MTIYGDCVKMCEDYAPNFGVKRTGCCVNTAPSHASFLIREILTRKQNDCRPPPTLLFSVARLKMQLKVRHFYTTEVIEAESQAVLNTLTEHDFQDAF